MKITKITKIMIIITIITSLFLYYYFYNKNNFTLRENFNIKSKTVREAYRKIHRGKRNIKNKLEDFTGNISYRLKSYIRRANL